MSTPAPRTDPIAELDPPAVRAALLARSEIALLDVREEDEFAQAHPLWAANLPLARIELDAWGRLPRRDTPVVVYGAPDEADARLAATRLRALGYANVFLLAGGLQGWRDAGGELFQDVNVPSKSFGEWLESRSHTPSLPAAEVQALIAQGADMVVLDARRYDEYQAMSIPGAVSVPGAELVLRVRDLAPDPTTRVIVNCAGRTRSLVGAQSLVNAGIPNPVAALRNGTIGWTLAGQQLDHGASRRAGASTPAALAAARADARAVAERAGVTRLARAHWARWRGAERTVYAFDVRTPEEYAAGHLAGFRSAPGGQLVQETDVHAPVRGARIVLVDHDGTVAGAPEAGVRAEMTASWLAQLGWEVAVLDVGEAAGLERATGPDQPPRPTPPRVRGVDPRTLAEWRAAGDPQAQVIDVTTSANHVKAHIPGAWFVLRSQLAAALKDIPASKRLVVTCASGLLAPWVAHDLSGLVDAAQGPEIFVLDGGSAAWAAAGMALESGEQRLASPRIDRYRRPYEGVDVSRAAMQAYLDWEFGLVEQLERDGTHFFAPI
jgi:rhodanese-related sulfurtransferase